MGHLLLLTSLCGAARKVRHARLIALSYGLISAVVGRKVSPTSGLELGIRNITPRSESTDSISKLVSL